MLTDIKMNFIWFGISEGANVIISKQVIWLDSWLLRLCNRSFLLCEMCYIVIV